MQDLHEPTARLLSSIAVIPDWAAGALRVKERALLEALKIKDPLAVADARRGIARIQRKLGFKTLG